MLPPVGRATSEILQYTQAQSRDGELRSKFPAVSYNRRGIAYDQKGEYDKAIHDYSQAIKLVTDYEAAYFNRGLAYDHNEEHDKAIADFSEVIKLSPEDVEGHSQRGLAYYLTGEDYTALADFTRAIEL